MPEAQFAAMFTSPITLHIIIPPAENGGSNENKSIQMSVTDTVKDLKERITALVSWLPPSKQQVKHFQHGFLKDAQTFASLNIGDNNTLEITLRSRGGGKR